MPGEGTLLKLILMGFTRRKKEGKQTEKVLAKNLHPPIFAVL